MNLEDHQKLCFISLDEIHCKADWRFTGKHVVGEACDEPGKAASSVLAFMVNPSLGAPAFVCRLLYSS